MLCMNMAGEACFSTQELDDLGKLSGLIIMYVAMQDRYQKDIYIY